MIRSSHLWCLASVALSLTLAAPAFAQNKSKGGGGDGGDEINVVVVRTGREDAEASAALKKKKDKEIYSGVIPGQRDQVKHLKRMQKLGQSTRRSNRLVWIGFKPEETRTRLFFQTSRTPEYDVQMSADGKTLLVVFSNTRIGARNFARFIDTSYHGRAIKRIETKRRRRKLEIKVSVDPGTPQPKISQADGYLYLDFPHTPKETEAKKSDTKS